MLGIARGLTSNPTESSHHCQHQRATAGTVHSNLAAWARAGQPWARPGQVGCGTGHRDIVGCSRSRQGRPWSISAPSPESGQGAGPALVVMPRGPASRPCVAALRRGPASRPCVAVLCRCTYNFIFSVVVQGLVLSGCWPGPLLLAGRDGQLAVRARPRYP